jgi:hypothetical protein
VRTGWGHGDGVEDAAVGVDHRADTGRGRADDGEAFLDRTEARLRQVLRRAPAAEPGVVGGVEDEVGAVVPIDDLTREDDFIADLHPDLAEVAKVEAARAGAVTKIDGAGGKAFDANQREERSGRQIFGIWHQMRLVVPRPQSAPRIDTEHAVARA